jgi:anti-sigma factor RsiW
MITCRDLLGFLHDYTAGALNAAQVRTFEEHVAACPPCVAYLDSYRATSAVSRSSQRADDNCTELPDDLVRAILAARDKAPEPGRSGGR